MVVEVKKVGALAYITVHGIENGLADSDGKCECAFFDWVST